MAKKEYEFRIRKKAFFHFKIFDGSEEAIEVTLDWYNAVGKSDVITLDFVPSVGLTLVLANCDCAQKKIKDIYFGVNDNGYVSGKGTIILEDENYSEGSWSTRTGDQIILRIF